MRVVLIAGLAACAGTFSGPSDHPPEPPDESVEPATLDVHVGVLKDAAVGELPRDLARPDTFEATPAAFAARVGISMLAFAGVVDGHACFTATTRREPPPSPTSGGWMLAVDSLDRLAKLAAWPPPRGSTTLVFDDRVCGPVPALPTNARFLVVLVHAEPSWRDGKYREAEAKIAGPTYRRDLSTQHDALFVWRLIAGS